MEEAENLCSRIGIICAGRLQCLGEPVATRGSNPPEAVFFNPYSGTLQHLKTKFGGTFFIEIKIPTARHEALLSFMSGKFSTTKLMEEPWQVLLAAARSCWNWRETGCSTRLFVYRDATCTAYRQQAQLIPPVCFGARILTFLLFSFIRNFDGRPYPHA